MDDRTTRRKMLTAFGAAGAALATTALLKGTSPVSAGGSSVFSQVYGTGGGCQPLCSVDSVDELRASDPAHSPGVLVTGYYARGDGGGGLYALDAADTTTPDNGGTVIAAAGSATFARCRRLSGRAAKKGGWR